MFWIDFFGGAESKEKDKLRKLIIEQKPIALTDIILTEILQGIGEDRQYDRVKQTLTALNILHTTPLKTYIHAADIYRTCRGKGFTVRKTNDCIIAAVAIEFSCELLHKDKDFTSIAQCIDLRICDV
ncbi:MULTISPECIES: PIN domain nuclease [unclassified Cohnella]|uniref:type II toxin-antitoxin system VapC family toxin n=1 Tax=unclassified Cohnella TaxID=2636738 RepID=UPI00130449BB|nr:MULTISPECIES: PIN domain nuclease [unclassified Cohnella]